MPVFDYEVADASGALRRGRAEADDPTSLMARFRETGQFLITARAVEPRRPLRLLGTGALHVSRTLTRGVGLTTLVVFTGQLAAMLAGGLHLARILSSLASETVNQRFRAVLTQVRDGITSGSSFADALNQHPHVFDGLYVAVVRAGELSGSLPIVLDNLTTYLEKTAQLRRKVVGAITYPAVILTVAVAIVFIMIAKLVPVFEQVYARANTTLPAPTRLLIAVSGVVRGYTVTVFLVAAAVAILGYVAARTEGGRRFLDGAKLRVPLFGSLVRRAVMARVCRTLSVLLNAGIPLLEAVDTVAKVSGNKVIEEALMRARVWMRDGDTIVETLRRTGQFPAMVLQLVAAGEESGTLPVMLGRAATYYEQQVDNTVATLSTLIEPIMIVIMGAIAGGVIFALYLPIFSLGQAVRGGLR